MMYKTSITIALLAIAQAAAFVPVAGMNARTNDVSCAAGKNLFSKLSEAAANPKLAISKAIAGDYDEATAKAKVESLIADTPVLLFSFTTCPFCIKAKGVLDAKDAKYTAVELNDVPDGSGMRIEMAKILGGRTSVPAVFINGEFIGGCNDGGKGGIITLNDSGELDTLLKAAGAI
mmetsp:Transcript_13334/g.36851  ORF Transcript_13334/g.36851 Transcript_13334/m.36851 type:complete len:176 (-) Transcript_13334:1579-2106(-)